MATIQRPEMPADLREPMEYCQGLVFSCQVLRTLVLHGFDAARALDPELFEDDVDPDPHDRDYLAGKVLEVLEGLDGLIRDAELGWADDSGNEYEPLLPFPDAITAAHHLATESLGPAILEKLAGRTFHESALEVPTEIIRYWRHADRVLVRIDVREAFSSDDWAWRLPDIDYAELCRQVGREARAAWSRLPAAAIAAPDSAAKVDTDGAHGTVRAHHIELFPDPNWDDPELKTAIIALATQRTDDKTDAQILRQFTDEPGKLQARIRAARGRGKTTLPRRD